MFLVFEEFKGKFITCSTDKLACSHCVRIRQDARFPIFQKSIYWHIICAISTTIPRKALFRRMTSEGEVRQIMKNIGFILWVLSTEITSTEFTVPRYETRRFRKHRVIKWKREQLRIYLNVTFSAYALKDLWLLIPTMDAGGWLRN